MATARLQSNEQCLISELKNLLSKLPSALGNIMNGASTELQYAPEVEKTAVKAEQYVETRLWEAGWDYLQPLTTRPGIEQMLVELDGSHVRTGKKVALLGTELTKKRRLPLCQRPPDWREVRVGFARPLGEQKDERTFVAQMNQYPELVWRLERAAFMQGMSTRTEIIAVALWR